MMLFHRYMLILECHVMTDHMIHIKNSLATMEVGEIFPKFGKSVQKIFI